MRDSKDASGTPGAEWLYDRLTADDEVRVCKDISESACREQPGNFLRHLVAAVGNKLGDELANARLVLPWALGAVAAPTWAIGLLVPIREAGALLPQVFFGAWVRGLPQRKRAWALGGLAQALAALAMAGVLFLPVDGLTAAWLFLAALAVQSSSRGLSSISSKDVLGKTIAKSRRGTVQGWAGSAASAVGLVVGGGLSWLGDAAEGSGSARPERHVLAALLGAAAFGWLVNAVAAAVIREDAGDTEGGESAWQTMREGIRLLRDDPAFRALQLLVHLVGTLHQVQ